MHGTSLLSERLSNTRNGLEHLGEGNRGKYGKLDELRRE
jgi:hypothetical protein